LAFRRRLLLALVALAVTAAGVQAVLGYISFRAALERDRAADLQRFASLVTDAFDLRGAVPVPIPERLPMLTEEEGRFRLFRDGALLVEGGGRFPAEGAPWMRATLPRPGGYLLEVALDRQELGLAVREYLRSTGVALAAVVVLGLLLAVLLHDKLLRPLRRLEAATEAVANERFPAPLDARNEDAFGPLARSFNVMVGSVRRALDRERSFTRYASHELRTPVANLKATAEAVRLGALPTGELEPVVRRNAERLERTLDGLLALARAHGPSEPVAVDALLASVAGSFGDGACERLRLEPEPATLAAPRVALEAAVRNLVDNALRYTEGPVGVACRDGPEVRISVCDAGPGVPEEALTALGTPFHRLRHDGRGLGLGLAFARQVAEGLGGRLELRNRAGGGLEAAMVLPKGART